MSAGFDVIVQFTQPVPGTHPIDGEPFLADRHVMQADKLVQDGVETTLLGADGQVVAVWPTSMIDNVSWRPHAVAARVEPVLAPMVLATTDPSPSIPAATGAAPLPGRPSIPPPPAVVPAADPVPVLAGPTF